MTTRIAGKVCLEFKIVYYIKIWIALLVFPITKFNEIVRIYAFDMNSFASSVASNFQVYIMKYIFLKGLKQYSGIKVLSITCLIYM